MKGVFATFLGYCISFTPNGIHNAVRVNLVFVTGKLICFDTRDAIVF